jgi:glycosyltransferase involved in cell wall biosynthesis
VAAGLEGLVARGRFYRLPQVAFVARCAAGPASRAEAFARREGTSPRTFPRARRELALLALAAGMHDAVADILASIPGDEAPDLELLRSRLAFDGGHYTDALAHARRAEAAGAKGAAQLADRAEGHLTVLRPGWLPDLGDAAAPLERLRGRATRGRIVHYVSVSLPYRQVGYSLRTQSVARCQLEAGLDPHVVTRAGFPGTEGVRDAPREQLVDGVPHHRVEPDYAFEGRPDRTLGVSARAAAALLEDLRPAAIHAASNHLQAQVALALARPLGIPMVYEVRGFWEESWASHRFHDEEAALRTDRYRMTREVETAAMQAADAVVTLSETMRDEILARGCAADHVVVVPNAVDIERFRPLVRDQGLASSLGIEPGDPVLGYVSSLNAYEGIPGLLEAAARLRTAGAGRRLRVLIVGDGPDEDTIRETAHRLGLDDGTLVMPGRVPHAGILAYYSLIDVFVVPRTANRVSRLVTPLKPYEAMAMEKAVVVSDLPALREIVIPGETGQVFRSEDADDLARVLGLLLDDPALRSRLGRQAREWVTATRTWTENGRRYRALYERLGVA